MHAIGVRLPRSERRISEGGDISITPADRLVRTRANLSLDDESGFVGGVVLPGEIDAPAVGRCRKSARRGRRDLANEAEPVEIPDPRAVRPAAGADSVEDDLEDVLSARERDARRGDGLPGLVPTGAGDGDRAGDGGAVDFEVECSAGRLR